MQMFLIFCVMQLVCWLFSSNIRDKYYDQENDAWSNSGMPDMRPWQKLSILGPYIFTAAISLPLLFLLAIIHAVKNSWAQ